MPSPGAAYAETDRLERRPSRRDDRAERPLHRNTGILVPAGVVAALVAIALWQLYQADAQHDQRLALLEQRQEAADTTAATLAAQIERLRCTIDDLRLTIASRLPEEPHR